MSIRDCRLKLPLPELWRKENWPGEAPAPGKRQQMCTAPWREERSPSMSVTLNGEFYVWFDHGTGESGDEIRMIMNMRGCGKEEAMRVYHDLAGVPWEGASSSGGASKGKGPVKFVKFYDYLDGDGQLVHQTVRTEPKGFIQRRPGAEGLRCGGKEARKDRRTGLWWIWTLEGIEPVLYHLPEILGRREERVWIVEGEKDADALGRCGALTTTSPMGARKWRDSYTAVLAGRRVVLCGDSDAAGIGHMRQVGAALAMAGCEVEVLDWSAVVPPGMVGEKWDAARWLEVVIEGVTIQEKVRAMKAGLVPWAQWVAALGEVPGSGSDDLGASLRGDAGAGGAESQVTHLVQGEVDGRPSLNVPKDGEDPREFAIALGRILGASGRFFLRADLVMTLHESRTKLVPMDATGFVLGMLDYVRLVTWVKAKGEEGGARLVDSKLNKETANQVLNSPQFRRQLPSVERVLPVPVPTWCEGRRAIVPLKVGWNERERTLVTGEVEMPELSLEEAILRLMDRWLTSWPYASEDRLRSLSTVVAGMLAPFCELLVPSLASRPAFVLTANKEGSGKTVLSKMMLAPVFGTVRASMVPEEVTDAELAKMLLAYALAGSPYVLLDNWRGELKSAALEGFLTSSGVEGRLLGESTMASMDKTTLVFVTANTVKVSPDMRRRSLFVDLFVEEVQPETRSFERWIDDWEIDQGRGELLACLWAIVRAWSDAGCPHGTVKHGTFRQWGDVIGGICEFTGLPSPLSPPKLRVSADRDLEPFMRVLEKAMEGELEEYGEFRSGELMEIARASGEFDFLDEDQPKEGTRELRAERKIWGNVVKRFIGCRFPTGYRIEHTSHAQRTHRRVIVHRPVPDVVCQTPSTPSTP